MSADQLKRLEPFLGVWTMEAVMPGVPRMDARARVTFEWLPGDGVLVQRWEVPVPVAPNGIAVIGFDADRGGYRQHYFDSRGVARIYDMGYADGVWTLARSDPDLSPLEFHQRWRGTFSPDGRTITGEWQTSPDGISWKPDFELRYERSTNAAWRCCRYHVHTQSALIRSPWLREGWASPGGQRPATTRVDPRHMGVRSAAREAPSPFDS
jgi:hypothetical protein